MRKTRSARSSGRKKVRLDSSSISLSCASEVIVPMTTDSPRAAARNAIWLQRMVFPLPGVPVTVTNWRCGMPPPSSVSKPAMPVGNSFLDSGSIGSLLDEAARGRGYPCGMKDAPETSKLAEAAAVGSLIELGRYSDGKAPAHRPCEDGMSDWVEQRTSG